jgi:hypothetical protein
LKQEALRASQLRDQYPRLAEVRVEFRFSDAVSPPPSAQAFSYFPAARGHFRYACPCHSCSGEFDVTAMVAELAGKSATQTRSSEVTLPCPGQRMLERNERGACPISAHVKVSATPIPKG